MFVRHAHTTILRATPRFLRSCAPLSLASINSRWLSTAAESTPEKPKTNPVHLVHFRSSQGDHPLGVPKKRIDTDIIEGEWVNPTINHVWSPQEIEERLKSQPRHQPNTIMDHIANKFLKVAYVTFNTLTQYKAADPSASSVAFRLIFLESVAAVPGMVAAQHRHFRSLRTLSRDYGWIHTLLEEAENERMHLLTFMQAFEPSMLSRFTIFFTQFGFAGIFIPLYVLSPRTAHRLVGYIEEMAVVTYTNIIEMMETPGTKLNIAWKDKEAPDIAKMYWRLSPDANFLDVIKQVAVDETNHRDVNHTFANLARDDPNPYVSKHAKDAEKHTSYWHTATDNPAKEGKDLDFDMSPRTPISKAS